jgi:hypothetical protein
MMLSSAMSEMTLLHPDDCEIVVVHVVQVRVLAATPDLRHMVFHEGLEWLAGARL